MKRPGDLAGIRGEGEGRRVQRSDSQLQPLGGEEHKLFWKASEYTIGSWVSEEKQSLAWQERDMRSVTFIGTSSHSKI